MTAAKLMADLGRRRIYLHVHAGQLVIDAPVGALTTEDREHLKALKAEVATLLQPGIPGRLLDDLAERFPDDFAVLEEFLELADEIHDHGDTTPAEAAREAHRQILGECGEQVRGAA